MIVPEPFLVLFRPGTSVQSGLPTFFVQKVGVWPMGEGGSSKERVRTADERRSVPDTRLQGA